MFIRNQAVLRHCRSIFVFCGATWRCSFPGGQDCARPAIASDFFQKSLAQGLTLVFEFSVLTLTVPGLRLQKFKIHRSFNHLRHFSSP
jgi:hypothetical protein